MPQNSIERLLRHINSINESIQFTCEVEENKALSFLDLNIQRKEDGSLLFKVYRKPTHNDKFLNYSSYNPDTHKASVVRSLQDRATKLCSAEYLQEENDNIERALQLNGYSKNFIQKQRTNARVIRTEQEIQPKFVSAPYIKGVSEKVSRLLQPYNIKLASRSNNTLRKKLCNLKDKLPKTSIRNAVYKIDCSECPATYIGETSRNTETRIAEHQGYVVKETQTSGIYQHYQREGHSMNWDNYKILAVNENQHKRQFIESAYSVSNDSKLNRYRDLHQAYVPLVSSLLRNSN